MSWRGASLWKIPSRLSSSHEYGVSPQTAAKAVRILRDEGLVPVVPGYGVFVLGKDAGQG